MSSIVPLERMMMVSYTLPFVTVALSLTIRPQFAIKCLQRLFQQGVWALRDKILGCSFWCRKNMIFKGTYF